jgi:mitogen-activated protein kinase kinase 1
MGCCPSSGASSPRSDHGVVPRELQRRNSGNPVHGIAIAAGDALTQPPIAYADASRPVFSLALPIGSALKTKSHYEKDSYAAEGIVIDTGGVHLDGADASFLAIDPSVLEIDESRKLGSGACATVIFAKSRFDGRPVAIKPVSVNDKVNRAQVLKEVRSLYTSDCECVVDFYGAFFETGRIMMVLEFMDLGGLDSAFGMGTARAKRVPEPVLACVVHQILFGLAYLYHEHTMHRDIKPANILINSAGRVKLTDLGISKTLDFTLAAATTFVGTTKYMSPERLNSERYDSRADIWSLGLVAMELATTQFPIVGDVGNQIELIMAIRGFKAPPFTAEGGGVSLSFVDFCAQTTAQDVERRPLATTLFEHPWLAEQGVAAYDNEACWRVVAAYFAAARADTAALHNAEGV